MAPVDYRASVRKSRWPKGPENVDSLEEAVDFFIKYVTNGRGKKVRDIPDVHGRTVGVVIDGPEPTAFGFDVMTRYYVLFKRNWENRFGQIYDKSEMVGQNISPDILEQALFDNFATIACVMLDNTVWICKSADWMRYCRENDTIRDVQWEGHQPYKEASIPLRMMKRIV